MRISSAFFGLALLTVLSTNVFAQSRLQLFTLSDKQNVFADKTSIASVEEKVIVFESPAAFSERAEILEIPLFDGKTYQAKFLSTEVRGMDDRTWRGKLIEGKFEGDVILTFRKGFVSGLIYAPDAVYEIIPRHDVHILARLDQSLFPECGGEITSNETENGPVAAVPESTVDSGDRIDVLVAYTTATKNFLGGDAQAQALSQQAIDATNTAYFNSKIRQRVRMVHAEEYLYTETSSASTDLSNLRGNASIQALRETHRADLVAMIGELSGVCGIGYLMGTNPNGNPNNGFSATARSCAVGNLTLAHEMGHNMGSHHNPENGGTATYPYSYGHYVNAVFRTVMSYVDPCPNGCARRAYFSNPTVLFSGHATGIDDERDNVRSINNTGDAIANYRYSGTSLTMQAFGNGGTLPRGIRRTVTWSSNNLVGNVRIELSRDEGTNWTTLLATTPNDGTEPISVWGQVSKRAWLRIVSLDSPHVSDTSTGPVFIR